jgi:septal ring factor EnvC (AmiA/AmiB activator)
VIEKVGEIMNAAYIKSQISYQEKRLYTFQNDLAGYNSKLARMKTAQAELDKKKKQYENEFKSANTSYHKKLMAVDPLGLKGVEKIQEGLDTAYIGQREKSFVSAVESTLSGLQRKITGEEEKTARCKQNITNTKNTIESLKRQYAIAVAGN